MAAFEAKCMDDESGVHQAIGDGLFIVFGYFKSSGGATGGDIETGFKNCKFFFPQVHANAVGNAPVVNEEIADVTVIMGGTITIVTDANAVGRWFAIGN